MGGVQAAADQPEEDDDEPEAEPEVEAEAEPEAEPVNVYSVFTTWNQDIDVGKSPLLAGLASKNQVDFSPLKKDDMLSLLGVFGGGKVTDTTKDDQKKKDLSAELNSFLPFRWRSRGSW